MNEQLTQLKNLQLELHQVNQDFAQAAQPLKRLSELSLAERDQVADGLRAQFERWESVTQQMSELLSTMVRIDAATNSIESLPQCRQ